MISVTVNLENEQVLTEDIRGLFSSLTPEQTQEIAQKALFKYLTDSVDYEKQVYIENAIKKSREEGVKSSSSWNSKTSDDLVGMTDSAISKLPAFEEVYLRNYKSPKESRFDEINKIIDSEISKKAQEFVNSNQDLNNLVEESQNKIAGQFEGIVKDMLFTVMAQLVVDTVNKANFSYNSTSQMSTMLNDIINNRQGL